MQAKRILLGLAAVVLPLLSATPVAHGDEGRTPLSGPVTLAGAGSYILTRDIATDSGPAIDIVADGVYLDLNGMTVTSTDPSSSAIRATLPAGAAGVTIRNGRIEGGFRGVEITGAGDGRAAIDGLWITGTADDGIGVGQIEELEVTRCSIFDAGRVGITVFLASDPFGATILENRIESPAVQGISLVSLKSAVVARNSVRGASLAGILIQSNGACSIVDNLVRHSASPAPASGIAVSCKGGRVEGNVAGANDGNGISTSFALSGQLVSGNVAGGNGENGIDDSGPNTLLEGNQSSGNSGHGIYGRNATDPVMVRGNMLRGNGLASIGELLPGSVDNQGSNVCSGTCP